MADYTLLSGTRGAASIDYTIATRTGSDDAVPGAAESVKCMIRTFNVRLVRGFNPPMVTFCSDENGWVTQIPGFKSGQVATGGYMAMGGAAADPLWLINQDFAAQVAATFAAGCSLTVDMFADLDDNAIEARGNSANQRTGVITGEPVSVWVTV